MTARDTARREPTAAQRAVLLERFDRICGAAWIITAGRGQQRAQRNLVPANEQDENGTHSGRLPVSAIGGRTKQRSFSAGRRAVANGDDVAAQSIEAGLVCFAASANGNVGCTVAKRRKQFDPSELAQTTFEPVAVDRGVLMTRHDDPDARKTERGSEHPDIEIRSPNPLPLSNDVLYVWPPRQSMLPRKTEAVVTRLRTCLAA